MPEHHQTDNPGLPRVEVFIVNYSGGDKTLRCVESLLASDYTSFALRIIDNPPRDQAIDVINNRYPDVGIIEPEKNTGYAGAIRIAAERCQSELLLICNNDLVFSIDCLRKMVETRDSSGASAVSARIVNPDETALQSETNATLNPLFFLIPGVLTDRSIAVYPSGACFLIERQALRDNLPPAEFFLYYEDVFIGMSIRASGGDIVQANDAVVHHDHGFSVAKMNRRKLTFYRERNRHTCMFTFFSSGTLFKLVLLVPLTIIHTSIRGLRGEVSFAGAMLAWIHASFSWEYIDGLKKRKPDVNGAGEEICGRYFTSRLLPDDAPYADSLNRFGRSFFRFFNIRTMD